MDDKNFAIHLVNKKYKTMHILNDEDQKIKKYIQITINLKKQLYKKSWSVLYDLNALEGIN